MPLTRRIRIPLIACALVAAAMAGLAAPAAEASHKQIAMFEDDAAVQTDMTGTLGLLRSLGVRVLRYSLHWNAVAPGGQRRPAGFAATDPASPAYDWSYVDQLVRAAPAYGIALDLSVTGPAPPWATAPGQAPGGPAGVWKPSASAFGQFVTALGKRYDGHFASVPGGPPLPAVRIWDVWNEPNFGPDLAPQAVHGSTVPAAAPMYRALLDAAWSALEGSGHHGDTVVIGNLDARGQSGRPTRRAPEGYPGNYSATKPLVFLRELYCVGGDYRPLRGRAAALDGCPTTAAGSRRFRAAHPALFSATGVGDHPYVLTDGLPPTRSDSPDPDFAEFSQLGAFAHALDRLVRAYGSSHRFAIYNNEYGYITNPPNHSRRFVSPAVAAEYINWAEYLSWRNPRIATTMQFPLRDPNPRRAPEYGGFASGLEFFSGAHKPSFEAYRLPIYLPVTRVRRGTRLLVWGCARPARAYGNGKVLVQFQAHGRGAFRRLAVVSVSDPQGYFETKVRVRTSGIVRLDWSYPNGSSAYSRPVAVSIW